MSTIEHSSRAMYSSWLWHQPTRCLFDVGEGVSLHLSHRVFGVRTLFCTHAHQDHVGGLLSLIGLRAKLKGDTGVPLAIYYPADNRQFKLIRDYVAASWTRLPYSLSWYPIEPGFTLQLDAHHSVRAFPMVHQRNATTLGYSVVETRKRLTLLWASKVQSVPKGVNVGQLLTAARAAGEAVDEVYRHNVLCYCLDNAGLDHADVAGADLLITDSTFLTNDERTDQTHATLDEALALARTARVKRVLLSHVSVRYPLEQQLDVRARLKGLDIDADLVLNDRTLTL